MMTQIASIPVQWSFTDRSRLSSCMARFFEKMTRMITSAELSPAHRTAAG